MSNLTCIDTGVLYTWLHSYLPLVSPDSPVKAFFRLTCYHKVGSIALYFFQHFVDKSQLAGVYKSFGLFFYDRFYVGSVHIHIISCLLGAVKGYSPNKLSHIGQHKPSTQSRHTKHSAGWTIVYVILAHKKSP